MKAQVAITVSPESGMLLKAISWASEDGMRVEV